MPPSLPIGLQCNDNNTYAQIRYAMAKSVLTCFEILKPTMNKLAQYPAQVEA